MQLAASATGSGTRLRRLPAAFRERLPALVGQGMSDEAIGAMWGVDPWRIACCRARLRLPNHRGWPCSDGELRRLVVEELLTDVDIAERYDTTVHAVAERRRAIGFRRSHDPRPVARSVVVEMASRRPVLTPLDHALATLGRRVTASRGGWWLDGRPATVVQVLRAGGCA